MKAEGYGQAVTAAGSPRFVRTAPAVTTPRTSTRRPTAPAPAPVPVATPTPVVDHGPTARRRFARGHSIRRIADDLGLEPMAVHALVAGRRPTHRSPEEN